jgi:hypothetical protein
MDTTDLGHERRTRARQARSNLAARVRHAAINATEQEQQQLHRITQAVEAGHITTEDAQTTICHLLTQQHQRNQAAA